MDAGQVHQLNHRVVSVGWQKMDALPAGLGLVYEGFQPFRGRAFRNACLYGHVGHAVHVAEPHDVFHVNVVAYQVFFVVVHINDTDESFPV